MDKSALYNQIANALSTKPASMGKVDKTKVGSQPQTGDKANNKKGMSNHNVRTKNAQNPNKTYTFDVIHKAQAKLGGH